jgi:hypothetical protein
VSAATNAVTAGGNTSGRPARADRPVRFEDPVRNAAYWARIDAIVSSAPPFSDHQRAVIRTAFSTITTPNSQEAA